MYACMCSLHRRPSGKQRYTLQWSLCSAPYTLVSRRIPRERGEPYTEEEAVKLAGQASVQAEIEAFEDAS